MPSPPRVRVGVRDPRGPANSPGSARGLGNRLARGWGIALSVMVLAACNSGSVGASDESEPPDVGHCRSLSALDSQRSASDSVPCDQPHTSETYFTAEFTSEFDQADYRSREVEARAARRCAEVFSIHLGVDQSTAMRSLFTWQVFWPTEAAWNSGARWFGCDLVGAPRAPGTTELSALPEKTRDLLAQDHFRERWLACATGGSVAEGIRVPCTREHDWRAVTTIKVGEPADEYPGDKEVIVRTENYCSTSVQAWLNYPEEFDFGYTWFGEGAWDGGNRRSVCWAKTNR